MFMCELALAMNMTLDELGRRMSNHELNVIWPAYYAAANEEREIRAKFEGSVSPNQLIEPQRGRP